MTGGGAAAGAAAAAAAAAQRRLLLQAEEEILTSYAPDDLQGWEFKILRAVTAKFKDPINLRRVLEEEAQAGWELVEKFDERRVRLKRRVDWREKDHLLTFDPYRSRIGVSEGALAGWVAMIVILALGIVALIVSTLGGN